MRINSKKWQGSIRELAYCNDVDVEAPWIRPRNCIGFVPSCAETHLSLCALALDRGEHQAWIDHVERSIEMLVGPH
jgi:hypothetical protein